MGNGLGLGRNRRANVMKINGETVKLWTPVRACQVVDHHPGHVLLDSESVQRFGVRARPLEPHHELKPKKYTSSLSCPSSPTSARKPLGGFEQMGAKDRLECLMLSRRAESDIIRPMRASFRRDSAAPVQVKMRIPWAQLDKLMEESMDDAEVARRTVDLYMGNVGVLGENKHLGGDKKLLNRQHQECHRRPALGGIRERFKAPAASFSFPSTSLNSTNENLSSFY